MILLGSYLDSIGSIEVFSVEVSGRFSDQDNLVPPANIDMSSATDSLSDPSLEQTLELSALLQSKIDMDSRSQVDGDSESGISVDVDPQILEALRSKDRLYVLKLGEQMEALIQERK